MLRRGYFPENELQNIKSDTDGQEGVIIQYQRNDDNKRKILDQRNDSGNRGLQEPQNKGAGIRSIQGTQNKGVCWQQERSVVSEQGCQSGKWRKKKLTDFTTHHKAGKVEQSVSLSFFRLLFLSNESLCVIYGDAGRVGRML